MKIYLSEFVELALTRLAEECPLAKIRQVTIETRPNREYDIIGVSFMVGTGFYGINCKIVPYFSETMAKNYSNLYIDKFKWGIMREIERTQRLFPNRLIVEASLQQGCQGTEQPEAT